MQNNTFTPTRTKFADFNSIDVEKNLDVVMFQAKERLVFLGQWTFGLKESAQFANEIKQFVSDGVDLRDVSDTRKANGLLALTPVNCLDIFSNARASNIAILREANTLAGKGYSSTALIDKITPVSEKTLNELDLLGSQLKAIVSRCDALQLEVETTFPATDETELQQTMFDLAIVHRLAGIDPLELKRVKEGDVPTRFNDARVIQALYRVPHAVHGMDAETVTAIRKMYAAVAWPKTTAALATARSMIDQAAQAVTSAAVTAEGLTASPAGSHFSRLKGLTWLSAKRGGVAVTSSDFETARLVNRFPEGMPHEQLPAVQDAD